MSNVIVKNMSNVIVKNMSNVIVKNIGLASVAWMIRIQPTFALVRVARGD